MKVKGASEAEIRRVLEAQLRRALTDTQWNWLVESGDVGTVRFGTATIEWLGQQVHKLEEAAFGREATPTLAPQQVRQRGEVHPTDTESGYNISRQDALCLAVAAVAARDPEVTDFQRDILGDRLLSRLLDPARDPVVDWIMWQLEREQGASGTDMATWPCLTYINGMRLETTPVLPGGILDRLRQLADRLATRYGWAPPAAVGFVLSSNTTIPTVSVLTTTIRPNHAFPGLTRIALVIDPAMTPDTVARAYGQARQRLTQRRTRETHPKTLWLAVFAAERQPREPVQQQIEQWNLAAPDDEWGYRADQAANFVRDRNAAVKRLLYPDYRLPDEEETITHDESRFFGHNRDEPAAASDEDA